MGDWVDERSPATSQMQPQWGKGFKGLGQSPWIDEGGKRGGPKGRGRGKSKDTLSTASVANVASGATQRVVLSRNSS